MSLLSIAVSAFIPCPLAYWGYKDGDIVMLIDDTNNSRQMPTRRNILDAMRWLVKDAQPHDALVFHCTSFPTFGSNSVLIVIQIRVMGDRFRIRMGMKWMGLMKVTDSLLISSEHC